MKLFKKSKEAVRGRQRPGDLEASERPAHAFSYYARSGTPGDNTGRGQAPPVERIDMRSTRRKLLENRVVILTSGIVGFFVIVYLLALGGAPKIVTLTTSGSTYFLEDSTTYQQTAARTIAGSVINSNKLTIDTNRIARDIKKNHAEIESVSVRMPLFGHSPTVYIKPYTPSFILTTPDNKAFLLDTNGRALVSASQITDAGELAVPTLQDKSSAEVKLGAQALPRTIVAFTQTVTHVLDGKEIAYSSLVLPNMASQLDVYIAGKPYYVKFDVQGDALGQVGTFLATKQRLDMDRVTPGEYIDVRVPERAYYK